MRFILPATSTHWSPKVNPPQTKSGLQQTGLLSISLDFPKSIAINHRAHAHLSELISFEEPKLNLLKLDPVTQARITGLLDKNNQGTITKREKSELERLVDQAEKISLHNARALVEYRRRRTDKRERRSAKEREGALQV